MISRAQRIILADHARLPQAASQGAEPACREHDDDQLKEQARQRMVRVVEHLREGARGWPGRGDRRAPLRWEQCAAEMYQSHDGEHRHSDDQHVDDESVCHGVGASRPGESIAESCHMWW